MRLIAELRDLTFLGFRTATILLLGRRMEVAYPAVWFNLRASLSKGLIDLPNQLQFFEKKKKKNEIRLNLEEQYRNLLKASPSGICISKLRDPSIGSKYVSVKWESPVANMSSRLSI